MNFADMLLGNYKAPTHKRKRNKGESLVHSTKAPDKRGTEAIEKYRSVMGCGWHKSSWVEKQLGHTRSSSLTLLKRWEAKGLVESRPAGGSGFAPNKGYEWRWK